MTVDPNDLLIFKMRPEVEAKGAKKPARPAQPIVVIREPEIQQPIQPQPKPAAPQVRPQPIPTPQPQPAPAPQAQPQIYHEPTQQMAAPQPPQQQKPPKLSRAEIIAQKKALKEAEAQAMREKREADIAAIAAQKYAEAQTRITDAAARQQQINAAQEAQPPSQSIEERYIIAPTANQEVVDAAATISGGYSGMPKMTEEGKNKKRALRAKDIRRIASHMTCENHPWRKAYAICDICKKAYCYEDIAEQGGRYYCLEDIDNAPKASEIKFIKYNSLVYLSSLLFVGVLLAFSYFDYNLLAAYYPVFQQQGLHQFIDMHLTFTDGMVMAGVLLSILSLLSAFSVLVEDSSSFRAGTITSLLSVALFGYQYESTLNEHFGIMAGLAFGAFITLVYSRVYVEPMNESAEQAQAMNPMLDGASTTF